MAFLEICSISRKEFGPIEADIGLRKLRVGTLKYAFKSLHESQRTDSDVSQI